MPKALTYTGLAISALLLLIFGLDVAIAFPFKRASVVFDIGMIVSALIIAYMGWSTLKEIK